MKIPQNSHFFSAETFLWALFLILLFVPIQIQMGESESFWSGIFMPFSTVFLPMSFVVLGPAIIASARKILQEEKKFSMPFPFLTWCWGAIFFLSALSLVIHTPSSVGIFFATSWLLMGTIVGIMRNGHITQFVLISLFGIIAVAQVAIAIWQTVPGMLFSLDFATGNPILRSEHGEILRASGTFLHPNILGFFLVFCFFLLGSGQKIWNRIRYVLLIGILFTFSRAAFLAILLGITLSIFVKSGNYLHQKNRRRKSVYDKHVTIVKKLLSFFLGVIFCIFGFWLRANFDTSSPSNVERISQIDIAIDVIEQNILWGVGIGNFPAEMALRDTFFPWELQPVHNIFLLVGSEMGIFGAMALLGIFGTLFHILWKQRIKKNEAEFGIFATLATFAMLDHFLITSHVGNILYAIGIGCILAPKNMTKS